MSFSIKLVLLITLIGCGLQSNKIFAKTDYYEAALQAYNLNDIDTAFIHLKSALQEKKDNLPAKLLLAEVLIKKNLYSSAEQELNDAAIEGADFNLIIDPLGRSLLLQGKFDLVLTLADKKTLNKQGELAFNLIKAKAYRGLSDTDAAEDLYKVVLYQYPENIEAILELASIFNFKNSYEKSQALLDKANLLAPESSRLWQVKGQLARSKRELESSIIYYNKANMLDPDNIVILRAIASSYIELEKPKNAQVLIEQALALSPNDLQTQLIQSNILRMLNKKKLSDDVLVKITSQLSLIDESYMLSQPELLLIDAMVSYGLENWTQAQNKFKRYIDQGINNNDMSSIVLLADVYVKLEKPKSALELLSNYETNLIKNKDYALILAGLYLQFNRNVKADYLLQKLQESYGDDEAILILSAKVLSNFGQDKEALLLLESSKKNDGIRYKHSLAVTALRAGELDKALAHIQYIISISPENIEYQLLYVRILLQLEKIDDAQATVLALYKKHPNNTQVLFSYASFQFYLNNLTIAKPVFANLVAENPEDGESWFFLAQIEYDLGNIEEAVAILERQTKNSEYRIKALNKLAKVHYSQKQFMQSLLVINVLLKENRLDSQVILMKAKNLIALEQTKEAKRQLNILLGLWREEPRNLLQLSRLQLRVHDDVGAEKSLELAYFIQPRALPIIIDFVKVKIRLNKINEASTLLLEAEKAGYKGNTYLTILRGDIELAKNNVSAAFNHYLSVLNKDEANVIALIKLSQVSQAEVLSNKFIEKLNYLVDKYPDLALQRHTLADHLFEHKKFDQAKFQYQLLIIQNIPTAKRAAALNNLAIIYLHENAYQAAIKVSKQAFEMLPSPAIIDTFGWSLVLSGETEQGLSYLRQAFSMSSSQPDIQYHIAYALVMLNRKAEAKSLLTQLIKLEDTFAEYKLAKQLLGTL